MLVKITETTYLNSLRDGDIIQGYDETGTMLIMGKYHESLLTSYNSTPIKNMVNVIVDVTKFPPNIETFLLRGIRYRRLYDTTWSFEREG